MPASRLRPPPAALGARPAREPLLARPIASQEPHPRWLPYAAAALIGLSLLQGLVVPLLPRAAEIPYSEFKAKLADGQIADVTLGTPIEGTMKPCATG